MMNNKPEVFLNALDSDILRFYFEKTSSQKWLEVLEKCSIATQKYFFAEISKEPSTVSMEKWTGLCRLCLKNGKLTLTVKEVFANVTDLLKPLFEKNKEQASPLSTKTIKNLIMLEEAIVQSDQHLKSLVDVLTKNVSRVYIHQALVPVLLQEATQNSFTKALVESSCLYLKDRVENKPQPPENWAREVPQKKGYEKQWAELSLFLKDPQMDTIDIRRNQNERDEIKNAINNVIVDLKTETIKKGSPHTLRITKTEEAYKRAMKYWEEDAKLLAKVLLIVKL
jgi:translation elongation factor EF-G